MPSAPTPAPSPQQWALQSDNFSSEWNPYVIVPLFIVCIAIMFFSYYRVLKQLLCSLSTLSFWRNQVPMRRLNSNDLQDPSSLQFQSLGLESTIMHSLPITQFKKKKLDDEEELSECAVCLGSFEEDEWLKHLPVCGHVFHVACIDTWFQMHSNCPICRSCICDLSQDYSNTMNSLIEALRREDFLGRTEQHYRIPRSEILLNNALPPREMISSPTLSD